MPPENDLTNTRTTRLLRFDGPAWRTADGYESELAAHRSMEIELRRALADDAVLLRQKDELLHRQQLLTAECDHRLLNNLQMIVALLSLQSQREGNRDVAARLAVAATRVQAIAGLHLHLHSMDGTPTVEFKPYLERLCRDHSTMSMSEQRPDQAIAVEAVELLLPTTIGMPLGLIVNELVTNAIKHGSGRITVTLAPVAQGDAPSANGIAANGHDAKGDAPEGHAANGHAQKGHALSVCNGGCTLPAGFDPAACEGLGMTLVSSLVAQIGGELRIDRGEANDCTRFTVLFG
jgi:two-component sensor histidine kinase